MTCTERSGEHFGVAYALVDHAIAQLTRVEPCLSVADPSEPLGARHVVDRGPHRLAAPAQDLGQQLVGQGVLKAAEAGHEGIDAFAEIDVLSQCAGTVRGADRVAS